MNQSVVKVHSEKDSMHLWTERSKDNLAWAFRAYKRFVESLSPEIQERLAHRDHDAEAYVVVFGDAQVGKTTLLLDLMGVSSGAMERVSTVLRGGREPGKSATATAMEYRRSPPDHHKYWGLQVEGNTVAWYSEDAVMTDALGALRTAMECRELKVTSPCKVFIPPAYFAPQADHTATVRMLDLPGDKPANPTEQEHVHAMARRYVPLADLILLVGRGDKLEFLKPGNLTLPGIEDWQSVPGRFRIITTYSFTPDSVRNLVRQHEGAEAERFQERLISEIQKFGRLSDGAKDCKRYFPMEFGKSWLDAEQSQPEIFKRVSPLVAKLKKQLHADIQAATTPMARLRNAIDAHVTVAYVKKYRLAVMKEELDKLDKTFMATKDDWTLACGVARKKAEDCCRFENRLTVLTDERLRHDVDQHYKLTGDIELSDPSKTVAAFKARIQVVHSSLKQQAMLSHLNTARETSWFWRDVELKLSSEAMDDVLNKIFGDFVARLNSYSLGTYFPIVSDDYIKDCQMLKICIQRAKGALTDAARQWWFNAALAHRENGKKQLVELHREHFNLSHLASDMQRPVKEVEGKIQKHTDETKEFENRMDNDLKESKRFEELLDEEYLKELRCKRAAILTDTNRVQSFMNLLNAVQLGCVRGKLLNTIAPA